MKQNLKLSTALTVAALALAGCYVLPVVDPQGNVQYQPYPLPPAGMPVAAAPGAYPLPGTPLPAVLNARLYPDNDLATQTGVVTGTVANMMNGKGRFQLQYGGEVLTGEATRVSNDERKGIASAFGSSGSYMSCEYQMNNPRQGAGSCVFSNGARYKLHIGS
ncbi:MAG: hypothetical protein IH606_14640 [Burkholderiales bacterium]|nr:hypothetical protein [Burkholderiales bacterium]